ncbi:MAG: RdgB/HAM1 family non-canonical purine NTP pyrophosphatase [Fimbriimonas ginsengisoli]|uniref:dITP/XTP pyrophosphatase n=1 Tax=Fimbriimonas ginsengisoli TaxID=1005039 RepID=A0A931PSQ7_FIMGI|nr:RdgB/HAM1 family non-canonical purine NTP pyrophosphatase [Fimbriimonas ginsengisoli]
MISRLVLATHNAKKGGEMSQILGARFPILTIATLADFPGAPEPEETGSTYAQNARIKAESAAVFTEEWSLADDAGLEIDALDGAPGLHSKRFEGPATPFAEKMARILDALRGIEGSARAAQFRCCVALAAPPALGQATRVFEATCEGRIAERPSGSGGFGYDPIFFLPEKGCTMADLTADDKHLVSHRGKVLRLLGDALDTIGVARWAK